LSSAHSETLSDRDHNQCHHERGVPPVDPLECCFQNYLAYCFRAIWRSVGAPLQREPDRSRHEYGCNSQAESNIYPCSPSNSRFSRRDACPSTSVVGLSGTPNSSQTLRHIAIKARDQRDRSFENQRYRASGLNLIVAAIILWNTVYLERAIAALRGHGIQIEDESLAHLSPIGWEHISTSI
jgi:hypothetical protein